MISHENCDWFQANNSTIKNQKEELTHTKQNTKNIIYTYTKQHQKNVWRAPKNVVISNGFVVALLRVFATIERQKLSMFASFIVLVNCESTLYKARRMNARCVYVCVWLCEYIHFVLYKVEMTLHWRHNTFHYITLRSVSAPTEWKTIRYTKVIQCKAKWQAQHFHDIT